jgi:hypothetical protein
MALKPVVADIAEVPEALRSLYVQKDGKHVLDVEGDVPAQLAAANGRLVEFRDNNAKLIKALGAETIDGALTRAAAVAGIDPARLAELKDVDPAEYRALKAKIEKLENKGLGDADTADAKFKAMLDAALKPMADRVAAQDAELTAAKTAAAESAMKAAVAAAFLKAGGKPDAVDFIVQRAKEAFEVVAGAVKAKANQYSADKPGDALGLDEWLIGQTKAVGFAFEPSAGGGATGGNGGGSASSRPGVRRVVNPSPEELGRLNYVRGKGLLDSDGQPVEIVTQ